MSPSQEFCPSSQRAVSSLPEAGALFQESTTPLRQALLGVCRFEVTFGSPMAFQNMEAKHERKSLGSRESWDEGTQLPKSVDNFQAFGPSTLTRQRVSYSFRTYTLISAFVLSLE